MRETVRPVPEPPPEIDTAPPTTVEPKKSYPLPATVIGCLVLLASGVAYEGEGSSATDTAGQIGYLVGSAFGALLIVWGIAWLVTIRHASRGWKIGSALAIALVGLLVGGMRL